MSPCLWLGGLVSVGVGMDRQLQPEPLLHGVRPGEPSPVWSPFFLAPVTVQTGAGQDRQQGQKDRVRET